MRGELYLLQHHCTLPTCVSFFWSAVMYRNISVPVSALVSFPFILLIFVLFYTINNLLLLAQYFPRLSLFPCPRAQKEDIHTPVPVLTNRWLHALIVRFISRERHWILKGTCNGLGSMVGAHNQLTEILQYS